VAYIVRSWPRLSQTFIVNEVVGLERLGVELSVFSMVEAGEPLAAPLADAVRASVDYLDAAARRPLLSQMLEHARVFLAAPGRYVSTLAFTIRGRRLTGGYASAHRGVCFRYAVHVAETVHRDRAGGRPVSQIHAHFAHDPALVGLLAHRLTGIPFSLTAHARDLYSIPSSTLEARVRDASAVVTCCRANVDYLDPLVHDGRLHLVHHGVDIDRFKPLAELRDGDQNDRARNGEAHVPLVLSVGRLVEKKGFPDLLHACAILKGDGYRFRGEIYGDGPMAEELTALRDRLGLGETVSFCGPVANPELVSVFQSADVFALTPRIGSDGDRDGLPNVLVEAMACGVPVVTTAVGGVSDLVRSGENGLVARPNDPQDVAEQLRALLSDPARRRILGDAARGTVEEGFDARAAARQLASLFGRAQ